MHITGRDGLSRGDGGQILFPVTRSRSRTPADGWSQGKKKILHVVRWVNATESSIAERVSREKYLSSRKQDPESWILMDDPKAGRPSAELTMRAGVDLTDGQFFICNG